MKKVQFFCGVRTWGRDHIYLTPSLYSRYSNDVYSANHYLGLEFQWIFFGIGIKFNWKNRDVKEYPDLSEIFKSTN